MIAAIASRTNNNFALMAILSFPILLPFLLVLMQVSSSALSGGTMGENISYLVAVVVLDSIVIALSYVLFPYLWRD
jgi:heme exporter protein B